MLQKYRSKEMPEYSTRATYGLCLHSLPTLEVKLFHAKGRFGPSTAREPSPTALR